jgi:hypothetical protein
MQHFIGVTDQHFKYHSWGGLLLVLALYLQWQSAFPLRNVNTINTAKTTRIAHKAENISHILM